MSPRRRLRSIVRIARWEAFERRESIDRRTLVVGFILLLIVGSLGVGAVALGASFSPSADIYRVGVDSDSAYAPVVDGHPSLVAHPADRAALDRGDIDLLVVDGGETDERGETGEDESGNGVRIVATESPKGEAALTTFRSAVESYNDRLLAFEANETAAYPVTVTLQYRSQSAVAVDGVAVEDDPADGDDAAEPDDGPDEADDDPADGDADDVDGGAGNDTDDRAGNWLLTALFGGSAPDSPADIQPPFPFSSLVLAFLFVIPMNFVIQAYGSSVLTERINRRGELLLVAPVGRLDIVAGKTLPYLLAMVGLIVAIAVAIGGGVLSVLAVLPIALTFLAATFAGAMFARSFKELTFVTVTISVTLTSYVFVPAIFATVTPIALISPLTLVVMELQGEAVGLGAYVFSTAAFYLSAGVLFLLGAGVYREEDMFTQKSVPLKFLDALDARLSGVASVGVLTALFVPFVFIFELLAIAVLFVLPIELSIPLILVAIAAIEEVAKSIHLYAGFESDRFDRTPRLALLLGLASGIGFFLAEKLTVIAQVVGLPELALGQAVFTPAGVTPTTTLALVFAPLVLHVVTASISALGARKNLRWYLAALVVATAVHALYNMGVLAIYA